jgi:hypothetical protein
MHRFQHVDLLTRNEVRYPHPSHGRIPNFRYCEVARVVKINPSVAQEPVRYLTLAYNKVLLTPTPSLGKFIEALRIHNPVVST